MVAEAKVVDASVVAALVFGEPRADEALSLMEGVRLYVPVLLDYELASVARKKLLRYPERRRELLQALELALSLDIRRVDVDHLAVLELSLETGLTTYDATYLHLARVMRIPLVTFDDRLAGAWRKFSPSGTS